MPINEEEIHIRLGFSGEAVERGTQAMLAHQRSHAETFKEIWKKATEIVGGLFSIERVIEFGKHLAESAHLIETTADRLNITTEEVQKLKHVAELTGSSIETIAGAFDKLAKSKESALGGNSAETNAFKDFGLTIEELKDMAPEEIFNRLSESIVKTGINTKVTADLMALMGKNAGELKPVLREFAEDRNTAPVLPESVIKNNAQTARVGTYAKEMFEASGSMWLSALTHPFKTYYNMFGNNGEVKFQDTNDRSIARLMATPDKPFQNDAKTFIVELSKQSEAAAKKAGEIEKEILKVREASREAGLSTEAKRLEIVKQIAAVEHDIAGAPFEGLDPAQVAELRLQKEKLITEEKRLQGDIDKQATGLSRRITDNQLTLGQQGAEYPTIGQLAKSRSPFAFIAQQYLQAQRDQINAREFATDGDFFSLHGFQAFHFDRKAAIEGARQREMAALGQLRNFGLAAPAVALQKVQENTAAMMAHLKSLVEGGAVIKTKIQDED